MNMTGVVTYRVEAGIAQIVLNRPDALNAMNLNLLSTLAEAFAAAGRDPEVKAVVVSGAGQKAFSAGADIEYLSQASTLKVREFARLGVEINRQVEALGKVTIAAIDGYALGGGLELAEACAIRIAGSTSMLGHPEVQIGAIAGFGGTTRLPRLIGKGRATEMLLTGRVIDASEALDIGLLSRVVASQDVLATATRLAAEIASRPATAVRFTWEALHRGMNLTHEESTALGADYFGLVAASDEFREHTRAFVEKRRSAHRTTPATSG